MQRFFDAQKDWTGVYNSAAINRRRRFLDRCGRARRKALSLMLREVRHGREKYIHLYLRPFVDSLEHESRVWNTNGMGQLLKLAGEPGDDPLDIQRRHEALRLFDEACALAHMEEQEPFDGLQDRFERFINALTSDLFEPGSERIPVYTYHDRMDSYRVRAFSFKEALERDDRGTLLEHANRPIACRLYRVEGGLYFIAIRDRVKDHFDAWLKMQKQVQENRPHPHEIRDRGGFLLIVPTIEVADHLLKRIRELIVTPRRKQVAGKIVDETNNLTEDGTVENRHSSRFFRAARLRVKWNGHWIEIQISTFQHYYSSTLAVNEENHEIYRLLQCFDCYFPFLFPHAIYGIDWGNENIRRQLMALAIAHLGWRVDRDTLPVHRAIT